MVRSKWIISGIAMCAVAGTAGVAYAASTAVTSSNTDVVVTTAHNKNMSTSGGTRTTIASVTLPAGAWVLSAHASLVNFGPSDYGRCAINRGTTSLGAASATVGDPSAAGNQGPASLVSTVSVAGAVRLTGSTVVTLTCWHDRSNGSQPYVDASASLVAHKSPSLVQVTQ
jgi:hypothetical protein